MNYFGKTKEIVEDIFLDKKAYLADLFLNVNKFDDFKNISQKSLGGILYDEKVDIKKFTSGDYIAISEPLLPIYNFLAQKLLTNNYYDMEKSKIFLYFIYLLNNQILDLIQNNYSFNKSFKGKPLIFLPSASFDFILHDKLFFELISNKKDQINSFFKNILENENENYSIQNSFIEDFHNTFEKYIKEKNLKYFEEQLKCVKNTLNYKMSNIKGVAGSAKTFTSMLSLLVCCAQFKHFKNQPYKILVTGQTYKSVEESVKKLSEITDSKEIKEFLNKYKINKIQGVFLTSISREKSSKYLEQYSNETLKIAVSKEFESFEDADAYFLFLPLPILTSAVTELDINTFKHQLNTVKNIATFNLNGKIERSKTTIPSTILSIKERLKNIKIPYKIDEIFNHIHIEEASQFSGVDLSTIGSFINPEGIYRFSFSGDPKQLSPIYNYKTTKLNLLRIGAFYNIFTLFEDTNIKTAYLEHSMRNPDYIIEIVKDIYPEFNVQSANLSRENHLSLNEDTEFNKAIKNALPMFRISYDIFSKTPFKNNLTTENNFETYIAKEIINIFNGTLEKLNENYFLLTLFKKQEIDLLKNNIKNCGTVDKLQGREAFLTGLLTSSYDTDFLPKVIPFIAVPNRINVALTRTKKYFFMIMSKNLENSLYSYFLDSKEPKEFEIGYKLSKNKLITEEKIKELLTQFDINLGIYILQKFIKNTNKRAGIFYLPLILGNDNILKIKSEASFQPDVPPEPFLKVEIFGLR